jgi:hypothetical protein
MQAAKFADRLAQDMARSDPANPERAVSRVYARAAAILDSALKLGKQPESIPPEVALDRLGEARAKARERIAA